MSRFTRSGRKKMAVGTVENEAEREVAKIAHELAAMSGVQVAVILNTNDGKQLCYGSPSIQTITEKLISSGHVDQQMLTNFNQMRASSTSEPSPRVKELKKGLKKANRELEKEKRIGKILEDTLKKSYGGKKTNLDCIDKLGIDELMELKQKLVELKRSRPNGNGNGNGGPCDMDITEN